MIAIRPAIISDALTILELVRELALYEREPDAVVATVGDLERDGFGASPRFQVSIAEEGATTLGFAFYFFGYSTWRGRPTLYLEDLFVRPQHRKKGVGLSLMRHLARVAVDEGAARMVWEVLDWNTSAIEFYESLGANILPTWLNVRLEGDSLGALAAQIEG